MRFRFAAVLLGLSQFAFPSLGFADWPGILEAPPGLNNLPFSIPTGDAHWCYNIREKLEPVSREEASFFFEGQKDYLAALLASRRAKMFRLPRSDMAVVARRGCDELCEVDIIVRSAYNVDIYKNILVGRQGSIEMVPSIDGWKTYSEFIAVLHDLKYKGEKAAFVYQLSRSVDRSKVNDRVEYGFASEMYDDCQTK